MDLLLKQRLVGAAVIISLGVVVIPMLLDGSGNRIIKEIPPRPERQGVSGEGFVKDQSIPSPPRRDEGGIIYSSEPISIKSKPKSDSLSGQSVSSNVKDAPAKEPVSVKTEGQGASDRVAGVKAPSPQVSKSITTQKLASWVVQVGSFTEKSKAISLRDQIRSKGFSVFMEQFRNSEQNNMYRVRVGPVLSRSEAEVALRQVKQQIKLENGYVTSHP